MTAGGVPRHTQLCSHRARELDLTGLGFAQRGEEVRVWARKGVAVMVDHGGKQDGRKGRDQQVLSVKESLKTEHRVMEGSCEETRRGRQTARLCCRGVAVAAGTGQGLLVC